MSEEGGEIIDNKFEILGSYGLEQVWFFKIVGGVPLPGKPSGKGIGKVICYPVVPG